MTFTDIIAQMESFRVKIANLEATVLDANISTIAMMARDDKIANLETVGKLRQTALEAKIATLEAKITILELQAQLLPRSKSHKELRTSVDDFSSIHQAQTMKIMKKYNQSEKKALFELNTLHSFLMENTDLENVADEEDRAMVQPFQEFNTAFRDYCKKTRHQVQGAQLHQHQRGLFEITSHIGQPKSR